MEKVFKAPNDSVPDRLAESMYYSLGAGGKRLRPALCLAAAERCGVNPQKALPVALAIECIHTASLIHDDLPCMDNDDYRRGRLTNHKVYGESLALIAGDSLMIWAFGFPLAELPKLGLSYERTCRSVEFLSSASGPQGMCGGQVLDTDEMSQTEAPDFVYRIAEAKTAALIQASVVCGALLGDISDEKIRLYSAYGKHLGLAFQIVDDILDVTATREELGKTPNKDAEQDKRTFIAAYGLDEAKRLAQLESKRAEDAMRTIFPAGDLLADLALELAQRSH